jgi:hypothetical protein
MFLPSSRPSSRRLALGRPARSAVPALLAAALAVGCDGGARPPDASALPSALTAEVSVRFDVSPQRPATISVLAFRAAIAGIDRADVLGVVDPLAALEPERDCALRDVDAAANALLTRGGSIELQELTGIGVGVAGGNTLMRPFPRLYPDVAAVVGGVVSEAGPMPLSPLPERLHLLTAASELPIDELIVPPAGRIVSVNGVASVPGTRFETPTETAHGLTITVAGGPGTTVEIRPFGATVAVACALGPAALPETTITVPRALLAHLFRGKLPATAAGGAVTVPASLDAVRRTRVRSALVGVPTRLSVEVRSSTTVELRP